jgi:voltage-gated potassium channel
LLWLILSSVLTVLLESILEIRNDYLISLKVAEWAFTLIFTAEYLARVIVSPRRRRYVLSFLGLVDLVAILPTYISLFIPGVHFLMVVRAFRLLRVFKVLRLGQYLRESESLIKALKASRYKITVFIGTILSVVIIVGALIYLVEGPENGFTSIPVSMYWAIVTLTTVGYGDISPHTPLGQMLASIIMILGYGVLAVPTGIVTAQLTTQAMGERRTVPATYKHRPGLVTRTSRVCTTCSRILPYDDAVYCKYCGIRL